MVFVVVLWWLENREVMLNETDWIGKTVDVMSSLLAEQWDVDLEFWDQFQYVLFG